MTIALLGFITSLITIRPYIKVVTNDIKFTHIAKGYKSNFQTKDDFIAKDQQKNKNSKIKKKKDDEISLDTQITLNLLKTKYDLKNIRSGSQVKPIYLSKLQKT